MTNPENYLYSRLQEIGCLNVPMIAHKTVDFSGTETFTNPLYEVLPEGIKINYFRLNGAKAIIRKNGSKSGYAYHRLRYLPEIANAKNQRYTQSIESGIEVFFPPQIIDAAQNEKQISRLILVEGEFKAHAICNAGGYAVGLVGIFGYGDTNQKNDFGKTQFLHPEIVLLLQKCKVEHVILLHDADALTINFIPDLSCTKDWSHRPRQFYTATYRFAQMMKPYLDLSDTKSEDWAGVKTIRYKHIKKSFLLIAKGADDLLKTFPAEREEIIKEFEQLQGEKKYCDGINLTYTQTNPEARKVLKAHLGTQNIKNFYDTYQNELLGYQFRYRDAIYEAVDGWPQMIAHDDGQKFMRVGADWFKLITFVNHFGELDTMLERWKIDEIKRDYNHIPGFIESLKRYDSFNCYPDFTPNYKRSHNGVYNLSNPLPHTPKKGTFTTISYFLSHIFSAPASQIANGLPEDVTGSPLTVFIDWLTIALRMPQQKLVVPILVSEANKTGKSTLLEFVSYLFGTNNSAILNNERFKTKFNGHYISKHIICIDEGFLDQDKKTEKEAMKQLITSAIQFLELKGVNLKPLSYYGKVIITSNDERKVMQLDESEDRWFVIRVPQFKEENPHILKEMLAEVPAFLYYLFNRVIHHPHKSRFWFERKHYITEQFNIIVKSTKTALQQNIDEEIKRMFFTIRPQEGVLLYDVRFIYDLLKQTSDYRADSAQIRNYLSDKRKMAKEPNGYYAMPSGLTSIAVDSTKLRPLFKAKPIPGQMRRQQMENNELTYEKRNCSPYVFDVEDWLTEDERLLLISQHEEEEQQQEQKNPF